MSDLIPDDLDRGDTIVAEALQQMQRAYRPVVDDRSPAEKLRLMAEVMIDRSASSGACTDEHLLAAGFTRDEIERWRGDAAAIAARVTADRVREKIKAAKRRKGGKHAMVD